MRSRTMELQNGDEVKTSETKKKRKRKNVRNIFTNKSLDNQR